MIAIRKFFASLLAFIQALLVSLGIITPTMKSVPVDTVSKEFSDFTVSDKSETKLYKTVEFASKIKNVVQCSYNDAERNAYTMSNGTMILRHQLTGVEKYASMSDKNGNVIFADTFKSFYKDKIGTNHYFEQSSKSGRLNTIRLGEYYYDCHLRDFTSGNFKVDKIFHVYGDRLYMQYDLLSNKACEVPAEFGSEIAIEKSKVAALQIKDKNGVHSSAENIDAESVEYAAFDIAGTGIAGFIVPSDGSTAKITVSEKKGSYIITQLADLSSYKGINKYDETGGYDVYKIGFGCRIYNDSTHSFDGIAEEAFKERNPLSISIVDNNANSSFLGYEALRGTYTVKMDGTGFNISYTAPDLKFFSKLKIQGDDLDRSIFIRTTTENSGCLECAALLDDNSLLMPVDIEVCKNFIGDYGDREYSYTDYQYGDTFTPIVVEKNSETQFTVLNLYQNWGNFPLKQISSIEFHVSYFHLSTGTTESNCIAPYFVIGRDGWTLPDFRCASGTIWPTQPQFNSVGILKFAAYRDKKVKQEVYAEFNGSEIRSYGPTYADIENSFVSDDGKYTYTLNHIEFPQKDENRTYYTMNIEFNDTVTFDNFRKDFDLFHFDGRFNDFNYIGYLDENNNSVHADISSAPSYHKLGNEGAYLGVYNVTEETRNAMDGVAGCNFALLIKKNDVTMNGQSAELPLVFREYGKDEYAEASLSYDVEKITFNKGDKISIDMILLPWGTGRETDDSNVLAVREDSLLKPVTVTSSNAGESGYIPVVNASNNQAEFTVKGGRNNNAVRIDGFTSMKKPCVEILNGGVWEKYELSSPDGYDGYMIRTNEDNTYSISFVYNAENPDTEYTFRITNQPG